MKQTHRVCIFLIFLFSCFSLHAIYFRSFTPKDGLSHPAILSMCQDSLGRLWFGTENGISIFDGNSFTSLKPYQYNNGIASFNGNVVKEIVCDKNGNVFFRTDHELLRYDVVLGKSKQVTKNYSQYLFAHNGEIYSIQNNNLFKWIDNKFVLYKKLPFKGITNMLIDHKGKYWIVCNKGLVMCDSQMKCKVITDSQDINTLYVSSCNEIWAGCFQTGLLRITDYNKIARFNITNSFSKGLRSNSVRQITEDKHGNIWFGTFNGLHRYNVKNDSFVNYEREDIEGSLSQSSVYSVLIDRDGVLWAGTYFGGVNYADISKDSFTFYTASQMENSLSNPVIGNMIEDKDGNIWICTEGGGLNMLNTKNHKITRIVDKSYPELSNANLKWIQYDRSSNTLYVGTNLKGLYSFDIVKHRFNRIDGKDENDDLKIVNVIAKEKEKLFLSTDSGIFVHYINTGKDIQLCKPKSIRYTHIINDHKGNLWVCGSHVELYDINTLKGKYKYTLKNNGTTIRPMRIFISGDNDVFALTYGNGIMKLDKRDNTFKDFPQKDTPLHNEYCYQMIQTPHNDFVTIGDKGINILDKNGDIVNSYQLGKYIPINSFVRDSGLLSASDGTIFIGGINGLLSFKESNDNNTKDEDGLYFSELFVNGNYVLTGDSTNILPKSLPFLKEIVISHEQNKIDIRFASKYHLIPFNQTVYEYRMKGIDDDWYQTTNNSIIYTNLPTGKYTLELRSLNNNIHNENVCKLNIRILPPWYATWWAILSFALLITLVVAYVLRNMWLRRKEQDIIREERREKEKIKEVNEAKFRFFTSVSHEFRTPLTLIIGQIELILQSYKLPPMVYNKMIKVMHQSRQLNLLVTELIDFRKYEQNLVVLHVAPCKISDYIYNIFDKFKELAQQRNIKYNFQPLADDEDIYIDSVQMNKVITNLLSNAFKFTHDNGEINVNISKTDNNVVQIKVIDNGAGMKEKDLPNIFNRFFRAENAEEKGISGSGIGLALVKDIIERHKGTIEVNSKEGYGSIFTIHLLIGTEHYKSDKNIKIETKAIENNVDNIIIDNLKSNVHLSEEETNPDIDDKEEQKEKDTVVIVEDNLELLNILKELFSPIYNVITAENGEDALEIIKSTKTELVLSDIMMPKMTGTELCSKIKKDIKLSHIPVVLLTALNMQEQYLEGLLKGADDYISKPFDSKILLARCNNIVRSRKVLYKQLSSQNSSALSLLATNSLDKSFLDKVTVIIEDKISNAKLNNDDIASEMNMSRSSFYNKFKDLTGETPNEFVNAYRLKKAAEILLSDNSKSIAEISEILGFNTPNYFCRKFKECYNVSPTQYKQQKDVKN